jgi:hypothetical protein
MNNLLDKKVNLHYFGYDLEGVMLTREMGIYFLLSNVSAFNGRICLDRKGYTYSYSLGGMTAETFEHWCTTHHVCLARRFNHES